MIGPSSRVVLGLRLLVMTLLTFHAVFTPVYEGPDEPFHLSRMRQFGQAPLAQALAGEVVDADLARSMRAWPCGPAMQAAFDCPAYGSEAATFNILQPARRSANGASSPNYQAHQPPLYYLAAAPLLELFAPGIGSAPESQIFLLRVAAVLLVGYVLCFPLRKLGKGNVPLEVLLLLAMLVPGAAESLIRVSNDVGVFAWSLLLLAELNSGGRLRTASTAWLAAVGPLVKLTALPLVVYAAVLVWRRRDWRAGALVGAAGLAVLPLQWLRGWAWGGTLEANAATAAHDSWTTLLTGLGHSAYTFLKTAIWLGGWASFRPPTWLVVAVPLVALALGARTLRVRPHLRNWQAHGAALARHVLGFVAFSYGKRQLFGFWGAVGGWYIWGWAPWLALLASDALEIRPGRERELITGGVVGALAVNSIWFQVAYRIYG